MTHFLQKLSNYKLKYTWKFCSTE